MMATQWDILEGMKQFAKLKDSSGGPTCVYGSRTTFEDAQRVNKEKSSHTELKLHYIRSLPPSELYRSKPSQWTSSSVCHQTVSWIQSSLSWTTVVLTPPYSSHVPLQSRAQRSPNFTLTTSISGLAYRTG